MHIYEVPSAQRQLGINLISDALPLWAVGVKCAGHKCEQIHESRLVGIAHWAFAVWQNPFGMLSPEVVMNLAPEVRDCPGYSHNHSPLITSNRNSHFEHLWHVSRQAD